MLVPSLQSLIRASVLPLALSSFAGKNSNVAVVAQPPPANKSSPHRPHVLMVVMDDLGSHDLGLHGSGIHTPTADTLAREGILLENYYVLPYCSSTRAALLSGRYPLHTGCHTIIIEEQTQGLPLDEETLPQVLRRAGYQAHAIGKWHIGHSRWEQTPTFRGFESFYGYYLGSQDYYSHCQEGGYDLRWDRHEYCGPDCATLVDERGNYSTHVFTRKAIELVDEYDESKGPLFLYLAYQAVHHPDEVPENYMDQYRMNKQWSESRKVYAGMLTAADEGLANVTNALKQKGLWDNTLVIYTTDNGGPTETCRVQGSSNHPRRGGKCSIWEGGVYGDAFVSGPALWSLQPSSCLGTQRQDNGDNENKKMRHTSNQLFHVVDWLPTLAAMANVTPQGKPLDGVNQWDALLAAGSASPDDAPPPREELYVGYAFVNGQWFGPGIDGLWYGPAIRYKQWKLVQGKSGGPDADKLRHEGTSFPAKGGVKDAEYLLYDVSVDMGEERNVAQENPEVVELLRQKLADYQKGYVPPQTDDEDCPFPGLVNTETFGPVWMPWCAKSSEVVADA